jgi:outer membrane receptor protein involved in Fe transport
MTERRARLMSWAIAALLLAPRPATAASAPTDSLAARADTVSMSVPPLEPVIVRANRLDVLSSETRVRVSSEALRTLPMDRVADALALQPGVMVDEGIVHVRGARPGELRVEIDGIGMNEPFRGEAPELPLIALDDVELIRGGLEADLGGGLAGTLVARPANPTERWHARGQWQTDGRRGTHFDRVGARVTGPVAAGLGIALGGEARLDDTPSPALRTIQNTRVLGRDFSWRANNHFAASARIAPVKEPGRATVQALVSREILRPFNPMFAQVGWTSPCIDDSCLYGPAYRATPPTDPTERYAPYNAADHVPVTDVQRRTFIATTQRVARRDRVRAAVAWNHERRLTSPDARDDGGRYAVTHPPMFGLPEGRTSDPFQNYLGVTPYFRKAESDWFEARADAWHGLRRNGAIGAGAGFTHERVSEREVDASYYPGVYDSVRTFVASAPGAYGWVSGLWVGEQMIAQGGMRFEWFSPGRQEEPAAAEPFPGVFSWSPRFGLSFPISTRTAFQVAYARIVQSPGREYLYDSRSSRIVPEHPQGNPGLEPATAISYEITLKHRASEAWSGRAGWFQRDLFRQISARNVHQTYGPGIPVTTGFNYLRYASEDAAHAFGFELGIERDDPGHSKLDLSYTWMRTEGSESFEDGLPIYPLRLAQPPPITEHRLAWDQPHRFALSLIFFGKFVTGSWTTIAATGLPWTPAEIRVPTTDFSTTNARTLPSTILSDGAVRGRLPRRFGSVQLGLEVRNVFDFRGQRRVSISGFPNPLINTQFDDYAAFREATGLGGGAYWNDLDGDGFPGWVRVRDPRLDIAPRQIRVTFEREW